MSWLTGGPDTWGACRRLTSGDIAQLGERRLCKPEAAGSSPAISTRFERGPAATRGGLIDLVRRRAAPTGTADGARGAAPEPGREATKRSLTTEYETLGKHSSALVIFSGQATKGAWWMPWHEKAMKDAISCDKPR